MLLRFGPLVVPGYTFFLDLGLAGGLLIACLRAERCGLDPGQVLDAGLTAALGGLLLARTEYVAVHWSYYRDRVSQALCLWEGGLAWHGGLAGGLLGVFAHCAWQRDRRSRRASFRPLLEALAPAAALLTVGAWLGCLFSGCAYGVETYPVQGVLWALRTELPDLYGIQAPRVPVQALGAAWAGVGLMAALAAWRYPGLRGRAFPLWLVLHGAGMFGLSFLRADGMLLVAGWRVDRIADLALALAGLAWLAAEMVHDPEVGR